MLFREDEGRTLAIAQPAHAWIAGQALRQWEESLPEALLFGAEQHDIAWLDWEATPSFNAATGRPSGFRELPQVIHAPMWLRGVDTALASYGRHVALLALRHGGLIYRRFSRPAPGGADAAAVEAYFGRQSALEGQWMPALGLDESEAQRQSGLVAFADALSLALCGDLKAPLDLQAPSRDGAVRTLRLSVKEGFAFRLDPWPFRAEKIVIEGEGWLLPEGGRFADAAAFADYFRTAPRQDFRSTLSRA